MAESTGGSDKPSLQSSEQLQQHPEIWKNKDADRAAIDCIDAMMSGDQPGTGDITRLQWRGRYLCLVSETSLNIPIRFLHQVFHRLNIHDAQALNTGMRLYRIGEEKRSTVLVLAPRKPSTEQQAGSATCSPSAHIPNSNLENGLVESVLRCVSHILKTNSRHQALSQSDSLWHKILSSIETEDVRFEDIPKDLLPPYLASEILNSVNSGGMLPVIHLFQHVVSCLGISYLFANSASKSSSQEIVITMENPELENLNFEHAIAEHVQLRQNKIAAPRVLAVSAQCPCLKTGNGALELDTGGSKSILYQLDACIACPENAYSSYVRDLSYYKFNNTEKRKQWKTIRKLLSDNHAFLLFVQDSASSPLEVEVQVGDQGALLLMAKQQLEKRSAQHGSTTQGQQEWRHEETGEEAGCVAGGDGGGWRQQCKSTGEGGSRALGGSSLVSLSDGTSQSLAATAAPAPAKCATLDFEQTAEIEKRIQVSSENPEGKIAQCASINLSYEDACETALQALRFDQTEGYCGSEGKPACRQARTLLSDVAIESSLAVAIRPKHHVYGQTAGWIFIDQLCKKLRNSTGFTHSLQSLDLDVEEIQREFKAGSRPIHETAIFQYMADRGEALMQAVKYHNDFYNKKVDCQIQALQVSVITDSETSYSKYVESYLQSLQEEQKVIFRQKMYAYLLRGMLADMKTMPELVICLPVLENERQSIFEIMRGI